MPMTIGCLTTDDLSDEDLIAEFNLRGLVSYSDEENAINMLRDRGYVVTDNNLIEEILLDIYHHFCYDDPCRFKFYLQRIFFHRCGKLL